MISATVRTSLLHLLFKPRDDSRAQKQVQSFAKRVTSPIMPNMKSIFAALCPPRWNTQLLAHARRCAFDRNLFAKFEFHLARFLRRTLPFTRARWRPFTNRIDQSATYRSLFDSLRRQIKLQQAHRALDIHTHWSRINVRWRYHHTTNRRPITAMRIRVQNQVTHARCTARIQRLLNAFLV